MAGADYVSCNECGKRMFYDGDFYARDNFNVYDVEFVVCDHCVNKLKKKIKTLEKHDRRRH